MPMIFVQHFCIKKGWNIFRPPSNILLIFIRNWIKSGYKNLFENCPIFSKKSWERLPYLPGRSFFELRGYFFENPGNSADTAVNLLRSADAPLWSNFCWELSLTVSIFYRKTCVLADIPRKNNGNFFWYWCRKRHTQSGNQFFVKKKKQTMMEWFLYSEIGCLWMKFFLKFSPKNFREKIGKIQFHGKNSYSVPSSPTVFVGVKIDRQLNVRFFPLTSWIYLLNFNECFLFYPILHCSLLERTAP